MTMSDFILSEKTILAGVILNDPQACLFYEQLLTGDYQFYKDNFIWVKLADQQLLANEQIISEEDLSRKIIDLKIDLADLESLSVLVKSENLDYKSIYDTLIDLKPFEEKRNTLQTYAEKMFADLDNEERKTMLTEFEDKYFSIKSSLKQKTFGEITDESLEEIKLYETGKNELLKTGITRLDAKITGIKTEDIVILGAYSGHGKTGLLVQMVLNFLKQKKKVLFISNEMSEIEIQTRFASHVAKVSENVVAAEERHLEDLEKLKTAMIENKEKYNHRLTIIRNTSFEKSLRLMKLAYRAGIVDVIALDYLQNFVSDKVYNDERSKIAYMCNEIMDFSKGYRIPIIATSQTTEKNTDSYKGAQDIRNMATIGLMMERDYLHSEDYDTGKVHFKAKIAVVKSRRGSTGTVYGKIYAPDPTFVDVTLAPTEVEQWDFKTYAKKS